MADVETEWCRRRLRSFVEQAWFVLEPATPFIDGWHIDLICEYLEAVTLGQLRFLILNVPPRHMKSLIVSVMWPVWEWGPRELPHLRYLFSSHSGDVSRELSVKRRDLIKSQWYRARWGGAFKLKDDTDRQDRFANDRHGAMDTTSVPARVYGRGGGRIVIDDPIDPQQAHSEAHRKAANRHVDLLYTRMNDKRIDSMILIMQRSNENDPAGHLQRKRAEMGWTVVELEAEASAARTITFPRSGRVVQRGPGELLWPEKEPREALAHAKVMLGSYAYAGQYQQRPAPEEGGHIKRAWWRRFNAAAAPQPPYDQLIISSDLAFKDTKESAHVSNQVWASRGTRRYLLDRDYDRMGITQSLASLRQLHDRWNRVQPVSAVLIEDKANGPAVIEMLSDEIVGVIPVEPRGSKFARAMAVAPQIEAGNVWLPAEPWADEVIDAWTFVPNGENWDDVDAASQALDYLRRYEIPDDAPFGVVGQPRVGSALDVAEAEDLMADVGGGRAAGLQW